MKLLSYERPGRGERLAVLRDGKIIDLADVDPTIPTHAATFLAMGELAMDKARDALDESGFTGVDQIAEWRPPVAPGRYMDFYAFEQHVRTCRAKRGLDVVPTWYDIPVYYNGNHRAMLGHEEPVHFPAGETRRDFELELGIVIGTRARNVSPEDALDHVAGYTVLNDWSARDLQVEFMKVGLGPARGKDFATSLGPVLVLPDDDDPVDPSSMRMQARVNGETWADNDAGTIHHPVERIISYASQDQTLLPGDVLGSGTVGGGCGFELDRYLEPGDVVELEIDGIGILRNTVAS